MPHEPLSILLSRLLLAFTIELDNAFEQRMAASAVRPFRVSVVMWSNFLRFVGDGIAVSDLPVATALPRSRVLSTLGGMERWRYVSVAPPGAAAPPAAKRDGYGSARGLRGDWIVRPTDVGLAAQRLWPPLFGEIEERWRARFGAAAVRALAASLDEAVDVLDAAVVEFVPVVAGTNGMRSEVAGRQEPSRPVPLLARLAQTLVAYTVEFEREAPASLPLSETVIHVLGRGEEPVDELPGHAALSPEAISMSLTFLTRHGYIEVASKVARLAERGLRARDSIPTHHTRVESAWKDKLGDARLAMLRSAAGAILDQEADGRPRLAAGLDPPPGAWRLESRYLAQTEAMRADPFRSLPRHPVVLHRGGWPDGS